MNDPNTFIIDAFNHSIYPGDYEASQAISCDISIKGHTNDQLYNQKIDAALRESINRFMPEFIIYNAGTDCMEGDPLGRLGITAEGII